MTNMSLERPIFIVGAPRSGTTMLRYMLCSHPRIFIPPEASFIPRFFQGRQPDKLQRWQAFRMIHIILKYRPFFEDWRGKQLDPVSFINNLPEFKPATLINALFSEYARQYGAERWGDKSPINTSYLDLIAQDFPSSQFIHIIRDGRDVALSMFTAYPLEKYFYIDVCYAARSWNRRVREAITSKIRLNKARYYELRYEEIVSKPEKLLREICDFLGEEYEPSMTEPHKVSRQLQQSKGIYASTRNPITTNSVGRWHREMSELDLRIFQALSGDLLQELGYETANVGRMSMVERAYFSRLQTKYAFVEFGRRLLMACGIFNPSILINQ